MIIKSINVLLVIYLFLAAGYDFRFNRIPNWLVVCGYAASLLLGFILFGWSFFGTYLIKISVPYFLIIFRIFRVLGMGDIKLISVVCGLISVRQSICWLIMSVIVEAFFLLVMKKEKYAFAPALMFGFVIVMF